MKISIGIKHLINSAICGLLWLLAGICILIQTKITLILSAVFLMITVVLSLLVKLSNVEVEDEMSELNQYKSKARTYNIILYGILTLQIFLSVQTIRGVDVTINLRGWIILFIGIIQFIEGILFRLYEKGMEL